MLRVWQLVDWCSSSGGLGSSLCQIRSVEGSVWIEGESKGLGMLHASLHDHRVHFPLNRAKCTMKCDPGVHPALPNP
jgi:hypothetical protein